MNIARIFADLNARIESVYCERKRNYGGATENRTLIGDERRTAEYILRLCRRNCLGSGS